MSAHQSQYCMLISNIWGVAARIYIWKNIFQQGDIQTLEREIPFYYRLFVYSFHSLIITF